MTTLRLVPLTLCLALAGCGPIAVFGEVKAYKLPGSTGLPAEGWGNAAAVAGMKVCLRGSSEPCVTTDAAGKYRLPNVLPNTQIGVMFEHTDFGGKQLIQRVTGIGDYNESPPLLTTESFNRWLAGSGCSVPIAGDGAGLYIGAPPGASVTITPAPSKPIVYMGATAFDPAATKIDPAAKKEYAAIIICGLEAGTYDLDFSGTTGTCRMAEGWPTTGHHLRAVVDTGALTLTNWICN